jgi:hypothetical protein
MTAQSPERDDQREGGVTDEEIYGSDGAEDGSSMHIDRDNATFEEAPDGGQHPEQSDGRSSRIADLPKVPRLRSVLGPSAMLYGASLGAGNTMFWPTLVAQNGWGIYWAFWIGVLTQFFINTEMQRVAMATGQSIFAAFSRLHRVWPWFFLVLGFFHLGWPGWAAGAGEVFAVWTGVVPREEWWIIGVVGMVVIWFTYLTGPVVYNVIERVQIIFTTLAILFAVILLFVAGSGGQLAGVSTGALNFGALPENVDIAVFLGGLAYAGSGGFNNLTMSIWAREKGWGMGAYQGRIKNPLLGEEPEEITSGFTFPPTETNLQRWKKWWNNTQIEHFVTWVLGLLLVSTVVMTIAAEYAAGTTQGTIDMWVDVVIPQLGGLSTTLLFAIIFIALFGTQYASVEVFTRNTVDIVYEQYGRKRGWDVSRVFFGALTGFVLWGILIIGLQFQQPWILLVIGAAVAGLMMWPYIALITIYNTTRLPEHLQSGWGRVVAMWWATGFFGYFSVLLIGATLNNPEFGLSFPLFETTLAVMGSGAGGYLLWIGALAVQVYTMYVSAKAKLEKSKSVEEATITDGLLS